MPFILFALIAAKQAHALDRSVDVQRQQYALQVAEFNMKYHTNVDVTKKNIIVFDPQTGTVSNQNINDVYHMRDTRVLPKLKVVNRQVLPTFINKVGSTSNLNYTQWTT